MFISLIFLVIGFVLLARGADTFVDGAVGVAHRFHIPSIVIGTTLVAMGTSAPEAAISIVAALRGSDGVSIGNIIGSNITNIFLILGVTALIGGAVINKNTKNYELPFVATITMLLSLIGLWFGIISRTSAFMFLGLFIAFVIYTIIIAKREKVQQPTYKPIPMIETCIMIVAGIAALIIGGNLVVNSAMEIARYAHVSERVIGLTIVALGTSLPELVVCVIAALKHEYDMAVGNIVGSNIFNILFVLGISASISPLPFDSAFIADGAIALLAVTMLMMFTAHNSKLGRFGGLLFLIAYVFYTVHLII